MQWLDNLVDKWEAFKQTPRPGLEKTRKVLRKLGWFFSGLWHYIYMFRSIIMATPVATASAILAAKCNTDLPELVQITLPAIDTKSEDSVLGFLAFHTEYVSHNMAVFAPLIITAACLLLTICSKRTFYPWLISIFTLVVPVFLLLTNQYL